MTNQLDRLRAALRRSAKVLTGHGRPRGSPRPEQVADHARLDRGVCAPEPTSDLGDREALLVAVNVRSAASIGGIVLLVFFAFGSAPSGGVGRPTVEVPGRR